MWVDQPVSNSYFFNARLVDTLVPDMDVNNTCFPLCAAIAHRAATAPEYMIDIDVTASKL